MSGYSAVLLDLGFAEFDVLARDRVVLLLDQLFGHGARVLLGDVIEAGVGRRHELDLDGDRFGHVQKPLRDIEWEGVGAGQTGSEFGPQPSRPRPKVKV